MTTPGEIHDLLISKHLSVAVAESCTGGLLGATLTSQSGSSSYMKGGVIAYSNGLKVELLGVSPTLIGNVGAVSKEVAEAMAVSVRQRCHADIGIAITGVAGPEGSEAKPAGLIYLCVATHSEVLHKKLTKDLGRDENRRQAVDAALALTARVADRLDAG